MAAMEPGKNIPKTPFWCLRRSFYDNRFLPI